MNARHLDWTTLNFFLETATSGTLAAAAQGLNVNPSTVHRRLAQLEEQLGARLFNRSPQGYELTSAGDLLLQHVSVMQREVFAIERKVAGLDASLAGSIRVATVDDIAAEVLPPILAELRNRHPELTVEVHVGSAFVDLRRSHADVALRLGARPADPDIVAKRVARVGVRFFASRDYIARRGAPRVAQELVDHDLVRGSQDMAGAPMEEYVATFAVGTNTTFRSNSMIARAHAIEAGLGVGALSAFVVKRCRDLVELDLGEPDLGAYMWAVLHPDMRTNARVRAFMDFVVERLKQVEEHLWQPR